MWRSSDTMNNSYLEDTECDSSVVVDSNYVDLKNSDSLDLSLYETSTTEAPTYHNDSPTRLYPLSPLRNHPPASNESGYYTTEYLSAHEDKNDSFCDHVSSIGLNEPLDNEIFDFCKLEKPDIQLELPMDFNALLEEDLSPEAVRSKVDVNTPKLGMYKKIKRNKRPFSNTTEFVGTDKQLKTSKTISEHTVSTTHSEIIKIALQRSITEPNLTGDFSKACYLPLVSGRHQDLKSITSSTMALLVKGEFSQDLIFKIIDCRYPYEYDGGHIEGASNLYTKVLLIDKLLNKAALNEAKSDNKRYVLIFHCEFSSNRAPTLYRFFRNFDRSYNEHLYPTLFYPEMYLLEGGYKDFYSNYSSLCFPKDYIPMKHPDNIKDLAYFREKTKSNAEQYISKGSNKKLNFV